MARNSTPPMPTAPAPSIAVPAGSELPGNATIDGSAGDALAARAPDPVVVGGALASNALGSCALAMNASQIGGGGSAPPSGAFNGLIVSAVDVGARSAPTSASTFVREVDKVDVTSDVYRKALHFVEGLDRARVVEAVKMLQNSENKSKWLEKLVPGAKGRKQGLTGNDGVTNAESAKVIVAKYLTLIPEFREALDCDLDSIDVVLDSDPYAGVEEEDGHESAAHRPHFSVLGTKKINMQDQGEKNDLVTQIGGFLRSKGFVYNPSEMRDKLALAGLLAGGDFVRDVPEGEVRAQVLAIHLLHSCPSCANQCACLRPLLTRPIPVFSRACPCSPASARSTWTPSLRLR